jgi:cytochrome c peroxidase
LLTPGSRFDRYLGGEQHAITEREKSGYRLFKDYGCAACHQGVNVGGNLYQKLGIMQAYFVDRPITEADLGRYNVTRQEADRHVFRVPSLRNVAVTPPYFHDGSVATLDDAIHEMAQHQLGRPIPEQDVELIAAFLHTLTGQYRGKPLQRLPQ